MRPSLSILRRDLSVALLVLGSWGAAQAADPAAATVETMLRLARGSGCLGCHQVERPATPDQLPDIEADDTLAPRPPVAPAWRDVATRYRHQPDALQRLTTVVVGGSNPYASHWKYEIAGLAMPANRVVVSEADARRLVSWILSLDDPK